MGDMLMHSITGVHIYNLGDGVVLVGSIVPALCNTTIGFTLEKLQFAICVDTQLFNVQVVWKSVRRTKLFDLLQIVRERIQVECFRPFTPNRR